MTRWCVSGKKGTFKLIVLKESLKSSDIGLVRDLFGITFLSWTCVNVVLASSKESTSETNYFKVDDGWL